MEKFTLINKAISRIQVFEVFEDSSWNFSIINKIFISYVCIFKQSRKQVMRGSWVEYIEDARNEYKNLLEEEMGKNL